MIERSRSLVLGSCPDFDAIDRSRFHSQELAIGNNMAPSTNSDPPPRRTSDRVVLLIDTENIGAAHKDEMVECARRHGNLVHCIGFGRRMDDAWKAQGSFPDLEWGEGTVESTGKNAADIDLTAAAVDLLHTEQIDIFCIASGDRDFIGLVRRLQNRGKKVVGIGLLHQSAKPFRKACDAFEVIGPKEGPVIERWNATVENRRRFLELVERVLADVENGWRSVSWLGTELHKVKPGIRYARYGKSRLHALLKTYPEEIETKGKVGREAFRLRPSARVPRTKPTKRRC